MFGTPALITGLVIWLSLSVNRKIDSVVLDNYSREKKRVYDDAIDLELGSDHMLILPGSESVILDFNKGKIAFPSKNCHVFDAGDLISVELVNNSDVVSRLEFKHTAWIQV
jgi:hypothetical protein